MKMDSALDVKLKSAALSTGMSGVRYGILDIETDSKYLADLSCRWDPIGMQSDESPARQVSEHGTLGHSRIMLEIADTKCVNTIQPRNDRVLIALRCVMEEPEGVMYTTSRFRLGWRSWEVGKDLSVG